MNKNQHLNQYLSIIFAISMLLTTALASFSVQAEQLSFWRGIYTYHVDRSGDAIDETNHMTSIGYNRWFVGAFKNSYSKQSEVIGYKAWFHQWDFDNNKFEAAFYVAAATGYDKELWSNIDGLVTIGLSASLGWRYQLSSAYWIGADVLYLPTDNGGVFASGLNLTIDL